MSNPIVSVKSLEEQKDIFENYAKNIHFFDDEVPELLENAIKEKNNFSILDLGCGEGKLLFAIRNKNLLKNAKRIVGVDISGKRIQKFLQFFHYATGIVSDACHVRQLEDNSFDIIISSMVIEHVPDDRLLLTEIKRLLKKDGIAYISSVIKGKYAFYIYRNNGTIRLDPTHIREYSSKEEFESTITSEGLYPIEIRIRRNEYSLLDIFLRVLIRAKVIESNNTLFLKNKRIAKLRRIIKIPIPGYSSIDALIKKGDIV